MGCNQKIQAVGGALPARFHVEAPQTVLEFDTPKNHEI